MQDHSNQIIQIFLSFVDKKPNSVRSERNILRPIRVTYCLPSLQWTEAVAGTTTQVWVQRGKSRSDFLQWRWAWVHFEHQKRSSFHDPSQFHQAWVFITSPWTKTVQELGGKLRSFPRPWCVTKWMNRISYVLVDFGLFQQWLSFPKSSFLDFLIWNLLCADRKNISR